jgi:prephenate dehydratase
MNTIQGIAGSFHHQVAQEYFNHEFVLDECLSFEELIDNLMSGKSDQAVMAIEILLRAIILIMH